MSDTITSDRKTADTEAVIENTGGAPATPADNAPQAPPPGKRKLLLTLLGMAVVAAGAAYSAYYVTYGRYHQSTDDAYVSGNLVQLTPQVSGTVVAVNADDTQIVKQGAPVVTLDGADAKIALLNAEATLGQTVRQVSGVYVNNDFYAQTLVAQTRVRSRSRQRRSAPARGCRGHRCGVCRRHCPRPRCGERRRGRA